MIDERVLITVKTYPTISKSYFETVCTGGIEVNTGQWRRLYPISYRYLEGDQQYGAYDIVDMKVRPGTDGRTETRKPDSRTIKIVENISAWKSRHQWVGPTIVDSVQELVGRNRSIGPVRVAKILDFIAKPIDPEWSEAEKVKLKEEGLFEPRKKLEKIPFDFRFRWMDGDRVEHDSMFRSWEVGQTWRRYRLRYDDPLEQMRNVWLTQICGPDREVSFFMGNLAAHRQVFMVCGIYNPPKKEIANSETLWNPSEG